MEKTFLKIARSALVAVIALSLLLTAVAAIYGAFQFLPSRQAKAPTIAIDPKGIAAQKDSTASESGAGTSGIQKPETAPKAAKECQALTPKIDKIAGEIGWGKKSEQVFNSSTMQYENKTTVDYGETVNVERFCKMTQNVIEEQNSKLSPYFKQADMKGAYYRELDKLLDYIVKDAEFDHALPPEDNRRYYVLTSIEWFNSQFGNAVDEARDRAIQEEAERAAAKVKGTVALYIAGSTFGFFFACCLILVFIRIEANTKDLVEVMRAFRNEVRDGSAE